MSKLFLKSFKISHNRDSKNVQKIKISLLLNMQIADKNYNNCADEIINKNMTQIQISKNNIYILRILLQILAMIRFAYTLLQIKRHGPTIKVCQHFMRQGRGI
jgi:hypothetical protein